MSLNNNNSLKSRTLVILVSQSIKVGIQIISIILFSRLLPPEIFGYYAMVAVSVALAELLRDFGISTTALSAVEVPDQDRSNMFWINVTQGAVACIAVALLSPVSAQLFNQSILLQLQPILAINLLINGFQIQYQVLLARRGEVWKLAVTDTIAPLLALSLGCLAFFSGMGLWSLAVQSLSSPAILASSRAIVSRWKPSRPSRLRETGWVFGHSWRYGSGQLISYIARNVDNLMIGILWGPSNLGIYSRAYQLQTFPIVGALAPLTTVIVPKLSEGRTSNQRNSDSLFRLQFLVCFGSAFFFSLAGSSSLILLPWLLGENWIDSAKVFLILSVAGIFESLNYINYWRFLAENDSRGFFVSSAINGCFGIATIVFSSFISIYAVAIAVVANQLFNWLCSSLIHLRKSYVDSKRFIWQGAIVSASGTLALVASYIYSLQNSNLKSNPNWSMLSQLFIVFFIILCSTLIAPQQRQIWREIIALVKSRRAK